MLQEIVCPVCRNRYDTCENCGGQGYVTTNIRPQLQKVVCPQCHNRYDTCETCRGDGYIYSPVS